MAMRLSKDAGTSGFRLVADEDVGVPWLICRCGARMTPKNEARRRAPLIGDVFVCGRCAPSPELSFSRAHVFSVVRDPGVAAEKEDAKKAAASEREATYYLWFTGQAQGVVIKAQGIKTDSAYRVESGTCTCRGFEVHHVCKHLQMMERPPATTCPVPRAQAIKMKSEIRSRLEGMSFLSAIRLQDMVEDQGLVQELVFRCAADLKSAPDDLRSAHKVVTWFKGLRLVIEMEAQ